MTSGRHTRSSVQRQRRPIFSAEPFARLCTSAPTPQWARRPFHPWGDIEGGGALVMGVAGSQRVGVFQGMGWNGRCGGATRAPACIGQLRGMLRIAPPRWHGASWARRTSSLSTASFCNGCMARADKINRESGHAGWQEPLGPGAQEQPQERSHGRRTRVSMQKSEYGQEATRSDQGRVSANNAGTQFLRNTGGCLPHVRQLLMTF